MNRYWLLVIGLFFSIVAGAQNLSSYAQHYSMQGLYSPARISLNTESELHAHYRIQWLGLNDRVFDDQLLYFQRPLPGIHSGWSLMLQNERIGLSRISRVSAAFSYALLHKDHLGLAISLQPSLIQLSILGNEIITPEGNYSGGSIDHSDAILPNSRVGGMSFSLDPALSFRYRALKICLSSQNLLKPAIKLGNSDNHILFKPNLILEAEGVWPLAEKHSLEFSGLAISDLSSLQITPSINYTYKNAYIFGMGFRGYTKKTQDAVILTVGYRWHQRLDMLYSYDLTVSGQRSFESGSHEIGIRYLWKMKTKTPVGRIIYNPRYL